MKKIATILSLVCIAARGDTITNIDQVAPHSYTNSLGQSNTYYGDNMFVAFQKVNGDLYFLGKLSTNNASNLTVVSNFLNSVSNLYNAAVLANTAPGPGYSPVSTNGGGYYWATISTLLGSANFIKTLNGAGTNTTFEGFVNLNNSNLVVSYTGSNGPAIPLMTSSNTPSGHVFSSSMANPIGAPDYAAFGYASGGAWEPTNTEVNSTLTYEFNQPVMIGGWWHVNAENLSLGGEEAVTFQTSLDSNTWTTIAYQSHNNLGTPPVRQLTPSKALYCRWIIATDGSSQYSVHDVEVWTVNISQVNSTNLGFDASNPTTNGYGQMKFTQGMEVDNGMTVQGNLDAQGLSIQGTPIQALMLATVQTVTNVYTASVYTASAGSGSATNFNGNYALWLLPPYYAKGIYLAPDGEKFGIVSNWTANVWPAGIASNLWAFFNFPRGQWYTNSGPLGYFTAYGGTSPTNAIWMTNYAAVTYLQPGGVTNVAWVDGAFYTNGYGVAISVAAPVKWVTAGVAGAACEALEIIAAPTVGGTTNYVAVQTLVTSLSQSITNPPCVGYVPTNAVWCWTNLSTGAGDSAAVLPGQIKYP